MHAGAGDHLTAIGVSCKSVHHESKDQLRSVSSSSSNGGARRIQVRQLSGIDLRCRLDL